MTSDSERFEFVTEISVRYSDVDTYGHVNNARYVTFLEEARIEYLKTVLDSEAGDGLAGLTVNDTGMVVANLEVEYRHPIGLVESATVAVRVPRLGESSVPMEYEIRSNDDVAAVGETTMVAYDRQSKSSRPIPDEWRKRITSFEGM